MVYSVRTVFNVCNMTVPTVFSFHSVSVVYNFDSVLIVAGYNVELSLHYRVLTVCQWCAMLTVC